MFLGGRENAAMERVRNHGNAKLRQKGSAEWTSLRLKIVNAATYVGRMTKAANETKSHACQGLHNGPDLAYGFRARCL
jgi:hypothetical protein